MRRFLSFLFLLITIAGVAAMTGCGGSSKKPDPPAVSVAVSPATTTVLVGHTQQFTATVTNSTNTAVTWQVNSVDGGNATVGTISAAGVYTAPTAVPNPASVTITAVSQADATKSATATVTVVAVSVSVSPATASLAVTKTQQFTASVSNATDKTVTWQVNGVAGGNATVGTISATGLYTAPAAVPNPATVMITAVAQADTTKTATATVTITPPPPVSVTVSPKTVSVGVGATQQFTATVANSDKGVTWAVNGIEGGDATVGTISTTGLYTAPLSLPKIVTPSANSPAVQAIVIETGVAVTITATSVEDPNQVDTATVTITPPPPITITITPSSPTVTVKGTQQFTATVNNASGSNNPVTWSITTPGCTDVVCGKISSDGLYTAPDTVPNPPAVEIAATLVSDTSIVGTAKVTIAPESTNNNAAMTGKYVFMFSGYVGSTPVLRAGIFEADGTGQIKATGMEDIRDASGVSLKEPITGGSYLLNRDNRGELTLTTAKGSVKYRFVVKADGSARMIEFDNTNGSGTHGAGEFQKQDSTALSLINGNYVVAVDGNAIPQSQTSSVPRAAVVGRIATDGLGNISSFAGYLGVSTYPIANGPMAGASIAADNTVATYGRSKLSMTSAGSQLGTFVFAMYMASSSKGYLISIDPTKAAMAGPIIKQQTGTYDTNSLSGTVIFQGGGYDQQPGSRTHTMAGSLTFGQSGITGTLDQNDYNTPSTASQPLAITPGLYAPVVHSESGCGELTFKVAGEDGAVVFCLYAPNKAFFLEGYPGIEELDVVTGTIEPLSGTPAAGVFSGDFALGWVSPVTNEVTMPIGLMKFSGNGYTATGDIDKFGTLAVGETITGTYTFTHTSAGRGTVTVRHQDNSEETMVFYMVSPSKLVAVSVNQNEENVANLIIEK